MRKPWRDPWVLIASAAIVVPAIALVIWGAVTVQDDSAAFRGPLTEKDLDPKSTLKDATGLILPATAKLDHFEYGAGMDDYLAMRFHLPKEAARSFMKQKPLSGWERKTTVPEYSPTHDLVKPRPPYQETQVQLPNACFLTVVVEESAGPWTVSLFWNES